MSIHMDTYFTTETTDVQGASYEYQHFFFFFDVLFFCEEISYNRL